MWINGLGCSGFTAKAKHTCNRSVVIFELQSYDDPAVLIYKLCSEIHSLIPFVYTTQASQQRHSSILAGLKATLQHALHTLSHYPTIFKHSYLWSLLGKMPNNNIYSNFESWVVVLIRQPLHCLNFDLYDCVSSGDNVLSNCSVQKLSIFWQIWYLLSKQKLKY